MRRVVLLASALGAVALGVACAPPPGGGCCGHTTTIARMTEYVGTIPSSDGGTPTTVRVSVATNGNTAITFENGGKTVVQAFTGTAP